MLPCSRGTRHPYFTNRNLAGPLPPPSSETFCIVLCRSVANSFFTDRILIGAEDPSDLPDVVSLAIPFPFARILAIFLHQSRYGW